MTTQRSLMSFLAPSQSHQKPVQQTKIPTEPKQSKHVPLSPDKDVPYADLCKVFERIESTTKRLAINEYLREFFVKVIKKHPASLIYAVYLCINRLGPAYESTELGLGETLLIKAIASATGRSVDKIKAEVESKGDLGLVAQVSKSTQATLLKP